MEALKKAKIDFSAAGLLGLYMALREAIPEVSVVPVWVVLLVILIGMIGRGIYLAVKDDGKLSIDEVADILGMAKADAEVLIEASKK